MKNARKALLSLSAVAAGVTPLTGRPPVMARAESATDITSSNAYHDVCILFNGGDFQTFSPFGTKKGEPLEGKSGIDTFWKVPYFRFLTGRPYKNDLYLYFYFDDANQSGFTFDKDGKYGINAHMFKKNGDEIAWSKEGNFSLTPVGDQYHVGTEWLAKFVVTGAFPTADKGDTYLYEIDAFGTEDPKGAKLAGDVFEFSSAQEFSYENANYDITSTLWGDKSKTVSVTKAEARPMEVEEGTTVRLPGYQGWTARSGGHDVDEFHALFFDLDRSPEEILSLDLSYTMIEYDKEALRYEDKFSMSNAYGHSTAEYEIPSGAEYVEGDSVLNKKRVYKTISANTKQIAEQNVQFTDWSGSAIANWKALTDYAFGRTHRVKTMWPSIVQNKTASVSCNPSTAQWIGENGRKGDGTQYQYTVFFDSTVSSWDKESRKEQKGWWVTTMYKTYWYATHHTAQGIVMLKMTVRDEKGKTLDWNVFMQPVNELPGTRREGRDYSVNDMWKSYLYRSKAWIVPLAIAAYAVLSGSACIFLTWCVYKSCSAFEGVSKERKKGKEK